MCRSNNDGGRRCFRANASRLARTKISERLARNRRVAATTEGERADDLAARIARDETSLANLREAIDRYGECVTPYDIALPASVESAAAGLRQAGMRPLLVGGSVRDSFGGLAPKDMDFEVYGGSVDDVAAAAARFGKVDEVGKSFGVLKTVLTDGVDVDLSVPRRENKIGAGHRGFAIEADAALTVEEAAARRDFTINAMSYDPELKVLIDPHHGKDDLDRGVLRHVGPAFAEDPLRVMRGMQFAARHQMQMDPDTATLCRGLAGEAHSLPDERVRAEWGKWAEKGVQHGAGLKVLEQTGWDQQFPGLGAVNTAALQRQAGKLGQHFVATSVSVEERTPLMVGLIARGMSHDDRGAFIRRTVNGSVAQKLATSVARDTALPKNVTEARTQAQECYASIRQRVAVAQAAGDRSAAGRLRMAEKAGVADGPEADILAGRDVLPLTGEKPGPWLGKLLKQARTAQYAGTFRDLASALVWAGERIGAWDKPRSR